ncbi:hypothetical protein BC828DRAFT_96557 [Blastocladiella britannica]|nr:hypothetical protein BC828DRAFT_96557 [Blastocladiella britannica]
MRLEPRTLELLDRIFDAFKSTHSRVQADEVRKRFSPSTHPDVIARTRRESTVLVEFLDTFTYDLEVTRYDLVRYYELARLAADDDTHLFDIVCGVWIDYVPDALKPVGSATGTSSQHLHTRMMREDAVQTPLEPYVRVRDAFESSRPTGGTYGSSTSVRKEMSAVAEEADDDLDSYALGRYERNAGTSTTATGPGRPSYRTMRATTFTDAEIDAEAARLERLAVDERSGYSTQFSGGGGLGYADSAALASSLPPPKSYVQSPWDRDERPASGAGSMTGSGGGGRRGTRGGPPASTAYGLPGSSANTAALPAEAGSSSHRRMVAAAATNGSDQYRPSTTFSFASPVAIGVHDGQTSIPTTTMRQMDSMHTARSLFATPARPLVRLRRCLRAEATRDLRPGSGGTLLVDRAAFLRAWINAGGVGTEIAAEALWRDLAHHGAPVHAADHEHPEPAAEISVNAICRALRVRDPTPRRVQIVDQAFTRLDVLDQGLVQTNVLKRVYDKQYVYLEVFYLGGDAHRIIHSAGTSSKSRSALADDMWGCFGYMLLYSAIWIYGYSCRLHHSDEVSRDEFQEFYADVGSTIEDDSFFVRSFIFLNKMEHASLTPFKL